MYWHGDCRHGSTQTKTSAQIHSLIVLVKSYFYYPKMSEFCMFSNKFRLYCSLPFFYLKRFTSSASFLFAIIKFLQVRLFAFHIKFAIKLLLFSSVPKQLPEVYLISTLRGDRWFGLGWLLIGCEHHVGRILIGQEASRGPDVLIGPSS